jgi:hypothetical protein
VSSIATRTFWPGRALGIQARTHVGLRSQQRFGSGRGGGDIGSWLAGTRLGWVAKPARAASSDIGWLNDACWLRLRGLSRRDRTGSSRAGTAPARVRSRTASS